MGHRMEQVFTGVGVAGHLARAVVFALIGYFLVRRRSTTTPTRPSGSTARSPSWRRTPTARSLLGLVAAGLVAFGLYSLFDARYRKV
jgi:type VI protein secretion system component VasF